MSRWWLPQGRCCCWLARSTGAGSALANSGCSRLRGQSRRAATTLTSAAYKVSRAPRYKPEQQAKDDREHPVHLAGVTQVVADQIPTNGLQGLPGDPSDHRTSDQLPGRDLSWGQHPKRQQEQPDVGRCRGHEVGHGHRDRLAAVAAKPGQQAGRGQPMAKTTSSSTRGPAGPRSGAAAGPGCSRSRPSRAGQPGSGRGPPREDHQPDHQADPAAAQPVDVVCTWSPMMGNSATAEPRRRCWKPESRPSTEPEHGHHDQQQGKQREERVVGDHRGQRAAMVLTELPHDRQREAQPSGTLLHR